MANDNILCIDVGLDSIKFAEFSYPPTGGMVLESFVLKEFGGEPQDDDNMDAVRDTLAETFSENDFSAKSVFLSISGQSAFTRFVKLPPIADEEDKVRQVVEMEARQNVPFPIDEVVWDYQLISSSEVDEEESEEIEVMFVVVKDSLIQEFTDTIEKLGKKIELVDIAPTCCYNAAVANEIGENECAVILNIGARCSSLVFIDSGRFFVRSIPIAGYTITQQISKEFGIPFADAEELKRRHGFVALGGAYEEPDSEVAATISKIVRNIMTRLHGEINRSINVYRSQQKGNRPAKLYLAGGSSVMAFTPRFFSDKLKIPVEYFNPFQVVSLAKVVDRESLAEIAHVFSEVIGLGLRGATICPIEISLTPDKLKKQHELYEKKPYFYASAASLVICMGLILFATTRQSNINTRKADLAKTIVERTSSIRGEVKDAMKKLMRLQGKHDEAKDILAGREDWFELYNAVQSLIPDDMWLVSITPGGRAGSSEKPAPDRRKRPGGSIFSIRRSPDPGRATPGPSSAGTFEWVELSGYYIELEERKNLYDKLKDNLANSDYFTNNRDNISDLGFNRVKPEESSPDSINNVISFKLSVKLAEPFER